MRSTFKILFYANKGKEKDGIVPIIGRITINGTKCQFSCKHSIPLAMWDVKGRSNLFRFAPAKNCAKGRSKEALQINRDLDNIKLQIIKHYQHLCDREAFVTAEMVRRSALATLCLPLPYSTTRPDGWTRLEASSHATGPPHIWRSDGYSYGCLWRRESSPAGHSRNRGICNAVPSCG